MAATMYLFITALTLVACDGSRIVWKGLGQPGDVEEAISELGRKMCLVILSSLCQVLLVRLDGKDLTRLWSLPVVSVENQYDHRRALIPGA